MQIKEKLKLLLENGEVPNLQLATQLIKGLGYQKEHLQMLIGRVIQLYFDDFLPDTDFHRFGCTFINHTTFLLIHQKLNEFLTVPYVEILVNYEGLFFRNWVMQQAVCHQIEVMLEELNPRLHFSVSATFAIGQKPMTL